MSVPLRRDTRTPPRRTRRWPPCGTSPCELCAAEWPARPRARHAGARADGQGRPAAAHPHGWGGWPERSGSGALRLARPSRRCSRQ
eukprot:2164683-Heterocapsa_arctica.AAC.1